MPWNSITHTLMWWQRNFQCQFRSIRTFTGRLCVHSFLYLQAALQEKGNKQGLSLMSSAGSSVLLSCAVWTFLGSTCPGLSLPPSVCPGLPSSQQSSGSAWTVPYSPLSVLKPPLLFSHRPDLSNTELSRLWAVRVPRGVASVSAEAPTGSVRGPGSHCLAHLKTPLDQIVFYPLLPWGLPSALLNALACSYLFLRKLLSPNAAAPVTAVTFCIRSRHLVRSLACGYLSSPFPFKKFKTRGPGNGPGSKGTCHPA